MITSQLIGEERARRRLQLLALPPAQRRRKLMELGGMARDAAKKRINDQANIDGSRYAPRRRKVRARQKMLRGLKQGLTLITSSDSVTITYKNGLTGRIARAQQEGLDETMTAAKMARRNPSSDTKPATRIQARALLAEGFMVRGPGHYEKHAFGRLYVKGVRTKAKVGWIIANMTMQQAGAILRSMRGRGPSSWLLPGTARSFLGASIRDIDNMIETVFSNPKTA